MIDNEKAGIEKLEAEAEFIRAQIEIIKAREDWLQAATIEKLWAERELIATQRLFTTEALVGAGLLTTGAALSKLVWGNP